MKKILSLLILCMSASSSFAVTAYDIRLTVRNGTNTSNIGYDLQLPGTGTLDGILCASGTTHLPVYKLFGGGLVMDSTSVYVDYTTIAVGGGLNMDDWMGAVDDDLDDAQSDISTLQSAMTGKPNSSAVSTVGFSGQYADILGLPTLGTAAAQNSSAFATSAQGSLADSAVQPAALSSYVTGSGLTSTLASYATTSALSSGLAGKFNTPAGTTLQYIRGDGSLDTFPTLTSGTVTSVSLTSSNLAVTGSPITSSGTLTVALPNVGTSGTYSGVSTDAQGRVTSGTTRSIAAASRGLNSSFQLTRDTLVSYSVDVSTSATLLGGQTGTVFLEYADDSGITTNVVEVARFVNGNSVSLAIAITITQNVTGTLTGVIPSGKYARIRTANTVGTPTFNYRSGQEAGL